MSVTDSIRNTENREFWKIYPIQITIDLEIIRLYESHDV